MQAPEQPQQAQPNSESRPTALASPGRRYGYWLSVAALVAVVAGTAWWIAATLWWGKQPGVSALSAGPDLGVVDQSAKQEALQLVDRLAQQFPDNVEAVYVRGMILGRWGLIDEAVRCLEYCIALEPELAPAYAALGEYALQRGQDDKAVALLRKSLELAPALAQARLRLGDALMKLNRHQEAVSVLEKEVQLRPNLPEAHYLLAKAHFQNRAYDRAKASYQAAARLAPEHPPIYYGLAQTCDQLGQKDEARKYLEKYNQMEQAQRLQAQKEKRQRDDQAVLRQRLAEDYVRAGRIYARVGPGEEALACWQKAAALDPQNTESRERLVIVFEREGKLQEAMRILEELQTIQPDDAVHWINAGTLHARLKQFDKAESALRKAMELARERAEPRRALAQLFLDTGRNLPEAKALAAKAVELEPVAGNYYLLSQACLKNGDLPGALTAAQRATQLDPGNRLFREALKQIEAEKQREKK
ncbi:MAG: tetratricopeptide repeat protein [Thermoguttaceae bacterium]